LAVADPAVFDLGHLAYRRGLVLLTTSSGGRIHRSAPLAGPAARTSAPGLTCAAPEALDCTRRFRRRLPCNSFSVVAAGGFKILLVLFLSFWWAGAGGATSPIHRYSFGGVRTFPLIGLIGYAMALIEQGPDVAQALGFGRGGRIPDACPTVTSWTHPRPPASLPRCPAGIYLVGGPGLSRAVLDRHTISVASMLLLEMKEFLEGLTTKVAPLKSSPSPSSFAHRRGSCRSCRTREVRPFHINPFKTWLVVVAVSGVSYEATSSNRLTQGRGGIIVSAILGGAYSSTVTTVVMARRAKRELHPHLFSGGKLVCLRHDVPPPLGDLFGHVQPRPCGDGWGRYLWVWACGRHWLRMWPAGP